MERESRTPTLSEAGPPRASEWNAPFRTQDTQSPRAGGREETAASPPSHTLSRAPFPSPSWSLVSCRIILFPTYMERLLFLLFSGVLLVLCWPSTEDPTRRFPLCTSCDEFVGKTCRKSLGSCHSKYPDFACQTKEVYARHFTGEYIYQYSILGCPRRCVEYIRITNREKNVFSCCNESYCNNVSVKNEVAFDPTQLEKLEFN